MRRVHGPSSTSYRSVEEVSFASCAILGLNLRAERNDFMKYSCRIPLNQYCYTINRHFTSFPEFKNFQKSDCPNVCSARLEGIVPRSSDSRIRLTDSRLPLHSVGEGCEGHIEFTFGSSLVRQYCFITRSIQ